MLLKLGLNAQVKKAKTIIEETADGIQDYLDHAAEVALLPGLKDSMLAALSHARIGRKPVRVYRHDKKRKFE